MYSAVARELEETPRAEGVGAPRGEGVGASAVEGAQTPGDTENK